MRRLVTGLLLAFLLCLPRPGYCWDGVGHMLIAQIAYDRLTPSAKNEVNLLAAALNQDPLTGQLDDDLKPYQPITAAAWPDDIKSLGSETKPFSQWHFIDLDSLPVGKLSSSSGRLPATPIPDLSAIAAVESYAAPSGYDVYQEIGIQSKILSDKSASLLDRARALAFVEHFVGDIHQPLHCIGRQLGGNRYPIDELPGADPEWHITNLHSFWDNAYRYTIAGNAIVVRPLLQFPRPLTPDTGEFKSWADSLVKNYLPNDPLVLGQTDPAAWAAESNAIAVSFAFPADNTPALSNAYIQQAGEIARERIALAGIRLANLLNSDLRGS